MSFSDILFGSPEKHERVSTLLPGQQPNFNQLQKATQGRGAGGAFGTSADYYRDLLSNDSADFDAFTAPEMRRYNQDIVPGLSEQFAGMGAGGLSSSGFRNAQVQGATDLSERLGSLRAQLRQNAAQGLQGIGQAGLGNYSQDVMTQQGTSGLLSPALGAIGSAIAGPALGAIGGQSANWLTNSLQRKNADPYGGGAQTASAQVSPRQQLPNFAQR